VQGYGLHPARTSFRLRTHGSVKDDAKRGSERVDRWRATVLTVIYTLVAAIVVVRAAPSAPCRPIAAVTCWARNATPLYIFSFLSAAAVEPAAGHKRLPAWLQYWHGCQACSRGDFEIPPPPDAGPTSPSGDDVHRTTQPVAAAWRLSDREEGWGGEYESKVKIGKEGQESERPLAYNTFRNDSGRVLLVHRPPRFVLIGVVACRNSSTRPCAIVVADHVQALPSDWLRRAVREPGRQAYDILS